MNQAVPWGRTDGRTDMMNLMVAFRNYAKAPKISPVTAVPTVRNHQVSTADWQQTGDAENTTVHSNVHQSSYLHQSLLTGNRLVMQRTPLCTVMCTSPLTCTNPCWLIVFQDHPVPRAGALAARVDLMEDISAGWILLRQMFRPYTSM